MSWRKESGSLTSECTIKLQYSKQYRSAVNRNIFGSWRKQRSSRKTSTSAQLTTLKSLTLWITTNYGKFLKRWKYQTTLSVSWETCVQVKKQQLGPNMEQLTGSKLGKRVRPTSILSPCLFYLYTEYITWNAGWMTNKQEKYQQPQICR